MKLTAYATRSAENAAIHQPIASHRYIQRRDLTRRHPHRATSAFRGHVVHFASEGDDGASKLSQIVPSFSLSVHNMLARSDDPLNKFADADQGKEQLPRLLAHILHVSVKASNRQSAHCMNDVAEPQGFTMTTRDGLQQFDEFFGRLFGEGGMKRLNDVKDIGRDHDDPPAPSEDFDGRVVTQRNQPVRPFAQFQLRNDPHKSLRVKEDVGLQLEDRGGFGVRVRGEFPGPSHFFSGMGWLPDQPAKVVLVQMFAC